MLGTTNEMVYYFTDGIVITAELPLFIHLQADWLILCRTQQHSTSKPKTLWIVISIDFLSKILANTHSKKAFKQVVSVFKVKH